MFKRGFLLSRDEMVSRRAQMEERVEKVKEVKRYLEDVKLIHGYVVCTRKLTKCSFNEDIDSAHSVMLDLLVTALDLIDSMPPGAEAENLRDLSFESAYEPEVAERAYLDAKGNAEKYQRLVDHLPALREVQVTEVPEVKQMKAPEVKSSLLSDVETGIRNVKFDIESDDEDAWDKDEHFYVPQPTQNLDADAVLNAVNYQSFFKTWFERVEGKIDYIGANDGYIVTAVLKGHKVRMVHKDPVLVRQAMFAWMYKTFHEKFPTDESRKRFHCEKCNLYIKNPSHQSVCKEVKRDIFDSVKLKEEAFSGDRMLGLHWSYFVHAMMAEHKLIRYRGVTYTGTGMLVPYVETAHEHSLFIQNGAPELIKKYGLLGRSEHSWSTAFEAEYFAVRAFRLKYWRYRFTGQDAQWMKHEVLEVIHDDGPD